MRPLLFFPPLSFPLHVLVLPNKTCSSTCIQTLCSCCFCRTNPPNGGSGGNNDDVVLGAVLGVVGALLLVGVVFLVVKKRQASKQQFRDMAQDLGAESNLHIE